jgi:phosphate-selective porin OprO/OprP
MAASILAAPVFAQESVESRLEKLERQNEILARQNDGLRQQLQHLQQFVEVQAPPGADPTGPGVKPQMGPDDVKEYVKKVLSEQESKKKAEEAAKKQQQEDEGYRIGSVMNVTAKFNEYGYLWLTTPNKDYTMHIGAWVQYDNVFWDQSKGLILNPGARPGPKQGVASGVAAGGIGDLEDGTFFRRIRPFFEGTLAEVFEYRLNMALENDQFETTGLDEFWVAWNKIPFIGTVRVGHVKTVNGLEADMTASSRTMTFMERASYSESIYLNQNFVTGLWFHNAFLDDRVTYTASLFRADQASATGVFFGDGQFGAGARFTALPLWECEGRHFLHLGTSFGWRNGTNNLAVSPLRTFQLRARPELRDDDPAGSTGAPQVTPDANSTRMVDTALIAAQNDWIYGLELLYVRGPFSIQAEWGWNFLQGAYGVAPTGFTLNPAIVPAQNYTFDGGYVQLAYTLTGESRNYARWMGTLDREYFKTGPFTNAWVVRDGSGHLNWGLGAWEIAARYSYTNLNSGSGTNRIQGGIMDGFSLALNWYMNTNVSCMFDWVYDHRYDVPAGTIPGYTSGFGMRVQLTF